jgi:hypothetical protein
MRRGDTKTDDLAGKAGPGQKGEVFANPIAILKLRLSKIKDVNE